MSARANRRAYSADQAVARARGRMNAKIDESIRMGRSANLNKTTARVTLQLPTNRYETLVSPDGTVSDAGAYYYQQLGIAPPSLRMNSHLPIIDGSKLLQAAKNGAENGG